MADFEKVVGLCMMKDRRKELKLENMLRYHRASDSFDSGKSKIAVGGLIERSCTLKFIERKFVKRPDGSSGNSCVRSQIYRVQPAHFLRQPMTCEQTPLTKCTIKYGTKEEKGPRKAKEPERSYPPERAKCHSRTSKADATVSSKTRCAYTSTGRRACRLGLFRR